MAGRLSKSSVITRTAVVGFHAWHSAPEDVAYLRSQHRHLFGIRVEVSVKHSDREVEFHTLKRDIEVLAMPNTFEHTESAGEYMFGARSCEMIAKELGDALSGKAHGYRVLSVEVDEDGENTGRVWWG